MKFPDDVNTITEIIAYLCQQFDQANLYYGHGTTAAIDDAATLLLYVLDLSPDYDLNQIADNLLTDTQKKKLEDLMAQRVVQKIPVAYIIGKTWFSGIPIDVTPDVLIPRSPIAELIEQHFEPWIDEQQIHRVLEIGTGSGCIAIACALYMPQINVIATDIDDKALTIAADNIAMHRLHDRVELKKSNLFDDLEPMKFDIIVSNPPYVPLDEWQQLPDEYSHEPKQALVAENNGLALVSKMLSEAADWLTDHGILIIEVGNTMDALIEAYPEIPFLWLDFERGGEGVFLLSKDQLLALKQHYNDLSS